MKGLKWWMWIVGLFYLVMFGLSAFTSLPVESYGLENVVGRAAEGDRVARYLVDTWIMFGLEMGVIGAALLYFSRTPGTARALVWTVMGLELVRGIVADIYMLVEGYDAATMIFWMVVHAIIIATGLWALREGKAPESAQAPGPAA